MKATAISPANIAFIKYWGRRNHDLFLPYTTTNSMNLSACNAHTTVELFEGDKIDSIIILGSDGKEIEIKRENGDKDELLFKYLDRVRELSKKKIYAKVISQLNFPLGAGIASSAAGMSAFVAAVLKAADLKEYFESKIELSKEVRISGSPSAARSVDDGYTELLAGDDHNDSYVRMIADENHWDLVDIIAVLNPEKKKISTNLGHKLASSSPFMDARIKYLEGKPEIVRDAILNKDFKTLAEYSEADSINMHAVMMTSNPAAYYLSAGSLDILKSIVAMREEGLDVFITFDAGPNAHIITPKKNSEIINKFLQSNQFVKYSIYNEVSKGTTYSDNHLF